MGEEHEFEFGCKCLECSKTTIISNLSIMRPISTDDVYWAIEKAYHNAEEYTKNKLSKG